jgi:hypothetical protein
LLRSLQIKLQTWSPKYVARLLYTYIYMNNGQPDCKDPKTLAWWAICAKLLCWSKGAVGSRESSIIQTFLSNDIGPKREPKPSWPGFVNLVHDCIIAIHVDACPKASGSKRPHGGAHSLGRCYQIDCTNDEGWWFDHHHDKEHTRIWWSEGRDAHFETAWFCLKLTASPLTGLII